MVSQRVWTCRCGWRSTAENVDGRGHKGEAPPHCRRCHGHQLTVTREKHPKITHVCKACGKDFIGHVGAVWCETCRLPESHKKAWEGRRKWIWTEERDQLLRDHYKSNATAFAARYFPGWPTWVITHRAAVLGLSRTKEKPWTKAEDAFLREHAGVHTPQWMRNQLRRRTVTAIVVRLKRLQISRRIQPDGLTMGQLEEAIGVDHRQIVAWFRSGRLKGTYRTNPHEHERYEFHESDVAAFLLAHPSAFRLDRVDQVWFMGLMRDAVQRATEESAAPSRAKTTTPRGAATTISRRDLQPCVGAGDAPCPLEKTVQAKPGIPARCPDCMLAYRRHLRQEEQERLRRIYATRPLNHEEMDGSQNGQAVVTRIDELLADV